MQQIERIAKPAPLFITGIGTGVGKTIVSAVLTEKLKADYWKPVQAGDLTNTDSHQVKSLITNPHSLVHRERYRLEMAASPHKSAKCQDLHIKINDFVLPKTDKQLLIEGAGGLMVPLSDSLLMIDLIQHFKAKTILVIRNYLGCINHSLLSYELLSQRDLPVKCIIMNGLFDEETKSILLSYLPKNIPYIHLPELGKITKEEISSIQFEAEDMISNINLST